MRLVQGQPNRPRQCDNGVAASNAWSLCRRHPLCEGSWWKFITISDCVLHGVLTAYNGGRNTAVERWSHSNRVNKYSKPHLVPAPIGSVNIGPSYPSGMNSSEYPRI